MKRAHSQEDEHARRISGTVVWLKCSWNEIERPGGTKPDGSPTRSCHLSDIAKLKRASVEALTGGKPGQHCPTSQNHGIVDAEIFGALLHNLGSPEDGIMPVENRLALGEQCARPGGLAAMPVGTPEEGTRPLPVGTQSSSMKCGNGDTVDRFVRLQRLGTFQISVSAGETPMSARIDGEPARVCIELDGLEIPSVLIGLPTVED